MTRAYIALAGVIAGLLTTATQVESDLLAQALLFIAAFFLIVAAFAVLYKHSKEWCVDES